MSYLINEIFLTIQGEGVHTGRTAVFLRFSRCNLWTGREEDRHRAICRFCDTDFTHGQRMELADIGAELKRLWGDRFCHRPGRKMVVLTGGEPLLQVDRPLINYLRGLGFYIAVETNGTQRLPHPVDWVCVSPKAGARLVLNRGDELKLVYPQTDAEPEAYAHLDFRTFWLSPMDGPDIDTNTAAALDYVMNHPQWRLNVQTHKLIGVR